MQAAASSGSASKNTSCGDLPPSSRVTGFSPCIAADGAVDDTGVGDRQLSIHLAVARTAHRHALGPVTSMPSIKWPQGIEGVRIEVEHRGSPIAP
jgi:hypothetical protein